MFALIVGLFFVLLGFTFVLSTFGTFVIHLDAIYKWCHGYAWEQCFYTKRGAIQRVYVTKEVNAPSKAIK